MYRFYLLVYMLLYIVIYFLFFFFFFFSSRRRHTRCSRDWSSDVCSSDLLKCMAWAGTGAFCVIQGGVLKSYSLSRISEVAAEEMKGELSFVQISDSHMGFNKPANPDVAGTLRAAVDKINALATPPEFLLHTGDISHLSKPEEFDTVDQILKGARAKDVVFVPGEHDVLNDDGKQYLERYGKEAKGAGWYSFDKKGVHFIGLVNVLNLKAGGLGTLGHEQLQWLRSEAQQL